MNEKLYTWADHLSDIGKLLGLILSIFAFGYFVLSLMSVATYDDTDVLLFDKFSEQILENCSEKRKSYSCTFSEADETYTVSYVTERSFLRRLSSTNLKNVEVERGSGSCLIQGEEAMCVKFKPSFDRKLD